MTCQQDFLSARYVYTYYIDRLTGNIPRLLRYIDNTLTYSNSTKAAFFRASNLLNLCGNKGVILISYKFQFVEREVEFLGFLVTSSKILPNSHNGCFFGGAFCTSGHQDLPLDISATLTTKATTMMPPDVSVQHAYVCTCIYAQLNA